MVCSCFCCVISSDRLLYHEAHDPSPRFRILLPTFLEASAALPSMPVNCTKTTKCLIYFYSGVPILALFSLIFGFAIMYLKEKEPLLSRFRENHSSLEKIIK
jgi:hypothetical protein